MSFGLSDFPGYDGIIIEGPVSNKKYFHPGEGGDE